MATPQILCDGLIVRRAGGQELQPSFVGQEYLVSDDGGRDLVLLAIDRAWIGDELALSHWMVALNEMRGRKSAGLATIELVDREEDFALVGYPALAVPTYGRAPRMSSEVWTSLAQELAQALAVLHSQGQVHGCLSTGLVGGRSGDLALIGYGIIQACTTDAFTFALRHVQSQGLALAPEMLAGQMPNPASDTWGWAMTMAAMALGTADQATLTSALLDPKDHPALGKIHGLMRRCIVSNPGQRPRDGTQLMNELKHLLRAPAKASARIDRPKAVHATQAVSPVEKASGPGGATPATSAGDDEWQVGDLPGHIPSSAAANFATEPAPRTVPSAAAVPAMDLAGDLTLESDDDFDGTFEGHSPSRAENSQMLRLSDLIASPGANQAGPRSSAAAVDEKPRRSLESFLSPEPSGSNHAPTRPAATTTKSTSAPLTLAPAPAIKRDDEMRPAPWESREAKSAPAAPAMAQAPRRRHSGGPSARSTAITVIAMMALIGGLVTLVFQTETSSNEPSLRHITGPWNRNRRSTSTLANDLNLLATTGIRINQRRRSKAP